MNNKIVYSLEEEEVNTVERLFHEKQMHEAVIAELVNSNPSFSVRDTTIYKELLDITKDYHRTIDDIIKKYTDGKYSSSSRWSFKFKEAELEITTD